jgi:hypothetical protein
MLFEIKELFPLENPFMHLYICLKHSLQIIDSSELKEIILKESHNLKTTQVIDEEKNRIFFYLLCERVTDRSTFSKGKACSLVFKGVAGNKKNMKGEDYPLLHIFLHLLLFFNGRHVDFVRRKILYC